jgi:2-phospho-L-lactate/phosphoenolpyruvate guanylyltransferase
VRRQRSGGGTLASPLVPFSPMRTLAILPMKSFGAAKRRLVPALDADSRRALAHAMFADVLGSLRRVPGLDSVAVVTGDPLADAAARGERVPVLRDPAQAGQSAATTIGISYALAEGFERVLLVPGDTPLLDPGEVAALLRVRRPISIVPDRHRTGTNALVLAPPDAIAPSFGPGSLERHVAAAAAAGVTSAVEEVPTLMLDVDTGSDLSALIAALAERSGRAPSTREALRRLERRRRRPAVPA